MMGSLKIDFWCYDHIASISLSLSLSLSLDLYDSRIIIFFSKNQEYGSQKNLSFIVVELHAQVAV